ITMVQNTKPHRKKHSSDAPSLYPRKKLTTVAIAAAISGHPKFRFRLSIEVLCHASSGPTPVRNRIASPIGIITLLKNGAPTLMRLFVNHSENTGNSVPDRTAMHATRNSKLLNRKLDSRDTIESSTFSLFR